MEKVEKIDTIINIANLTFKAYKKLKHKKKGKKIWIRDILMDRDQFGFVGHLIPKLESNDEEYYFDFMRMTPNTFYFLLSLVENRIKKKDTRWREAISAKYRLALTIYYLATGNSKRSLCFDFLIGRSTCCSILSEVCQAIWDVLSPKYLKFPTTPEQWQTISTDFCNKWQFPICVGALDGKHVIVECPPNSGSINFNYKGTFSKVLLALVDANYKFIVVDIGHYGSESDGGIFQRSKFGNLLIDNKLNFPPPATIKYFDHPAHYAVVADEAFPLKPNLLRPYGGRNLSFKQKIFNYRLSRARRISENAFGIWANKWRFLRKPIKASEKNVDLYVMASLCLHNFLISSSKKYCPPCLVDTEDVHGNIILGQWRSEEQTQGLRPITPCANHTYLTSAAEYRDNLSDFFVGPGAVCWQNKKING